MDDHYDQSQVPKHRKKRNRAKVPKPDIAWDEIPVYEGDDRYAHIRLRTELTSTEKGLRRAECIEEGQHDLVRDDRYWVWCQRCGDIPTWHIKGKPDDIALAFDEPKEPTDDQRA